MSILRTSAVDPAGGAGAGVPAGNSDALHLTGEWRKAHPA